MARKQEKITARVNTSFNVEVIKVLDHLKGNEDGTLKSYTQVIEDLLEESETFVTIKILISQLEKQKVLRNIANKKAMNEPIEDTKHWIENQNILKQLENISTSNDVLIEN